MNLKSIKDQWRVIREDLFLNSAEKSFIRFNRTRSSIQKYGQKGPLKKAQKKLSILIQTPEDYMYLTWFSSLISSLKQDYQLNLHWTNIYFPFRYSGKLANLKTKDFYQRRWNKLYLSNGGRIVFTQMVPDQKISLESKAVGNQFFSTLTEKFQLLAFTHAEIAIGDLIYDTYLRFKPAATVDLTDPFLHELIIAAVEATSRAKKHFAEHHYDFYFTSYGSYIHHGILVRCALAAEIKVIAFDSYNQISKIVLPLLPSHTKHFFHYGKFFNQLSLSEKESAREKGKIFLEQRFNGVIDAATQYMRSNAFHKIDDSSPVPLALKGTGKKRVIIFLHCFFDSPHIYRGMIYEDFYEWIHGTLNFILKNRLNEQYDVYVKPHPNGLPGNEALIAELKNAFPTISFIPKEINNNQLIREGFDLGITVYGTLAHEFPYFGIPVLSAGDNPHIDYRFTTHAQTKKEYENFLRDIDSIPKPNENSREEIAEFYYMHNLFPFPGKLTSEETLHVLKILKGLSAPEELQKYVDRCESDPAFCANLDNLLYQSLKQVIDSVAEGD